MVGLDEQIERLRREGIKEGTLYDCPQKLHAAKMEREGKSYCEGHLVGVGGVAISASCLDCSHYLSTGREKPHPRR